MLRSVAHGDSAILVCESHRSQTARTSLLRVYQRPDAVCLSTCGTSTCHVIALEPCEPPQSFCSHSIVSRSRARTFFFVVTAEKTAAARRSFPSRTLVLTCCWQHSGNLKGRREQRSRLEETAAAFCPFDSSLKNFSFDLKSSCDIGRLDNLLFLNESLENSHCLWIPVSRRGKAWEVKVVVLW